MRLLLSRACENGHMALASRLFPHVPQLFEETHNLQTFLRYVAEAGCCDLAKIIATKTQEPMFPSTLGAAAKGGSLSLVQYLIETKLCNPALPEAGRFGSSWAYDRAAQAGHIHIMRYLKSLPEGDGGARVQEAKSPLQCAARKGHFEIEIGRAHV